MGIIVESLYLDSLKNDHSNVIVDRRSIIGSISFTGASVVDFISLVPLIICCPFFAAFIKPLEILNEMMIMVLVVSE